MPDRIEPYLLWKIFLSLIIAAILFIGIFFIANSVSYLNYQKINTGNNLIQEYILDLNKSIENFKCDSQILSESSIKLDDVGFKIGLLEKRFGDDDERVLYQKNFYSILEDNHYNIINSYNNKCQGKFITILFFYSNTEGVKDESEKIGFILDAFKSKYKNEAMVYSFDYDINSSFMDKLKSENNVSEVPIVIVNNKKIHLKNINQLEGLRNIQ